MRATLFELGLWLGSLVVAYQVSGLYRSAVLVVAGGMCVRMLVAYYEEWGRLKRIEEALGDYVAELPPAGQRPGTPTRLRAI